MSTEKTSVLAVRRERVRSAGRVKHRLNAPAPLHHPGCYLDIDAPLALLSSLVCAHLPYLFHLFAVPMDRNQSFLHHLPAFTLI